MQKVKHTKNELKRQKDNLRRFTRYLPTLVLKKKQLQIEIGRILHKIEVLEKDIAAFRESVDEWVAVFAPLEKTFLTGFAEDVHIEKLIRVEKAHLSTGNIAGIDIPIFEKVEFKEEEYDLIRMPLWVDYGIEAVKELDTLKIRYQIMQSQFELIRDELRITTQRVSLFEKIKIPEANENIRRISIFLGDLQTQAVVTGKIAKNKIERRIGAGSQS